MGNCHHTTKISLGEVTGFDIAGLTIRFSHKARNKKVLIPYFFSNFFSSPDPGHSPVDGYVDLETSAICHKVVPLDDKKLNCVIKNRGVKKEIRRQDFQGYIEIVDDRLRSEFLVKKNLESAFSTILLLVLNELLACRGGVLLHASGVEHEGKVWIFAGESGAGKTTIATSLSGNGRTHSVDRIALLPKVTGEWLASPTPFSDTKCILKNTQPKPVAGLCFIEQHHEHRLSELPDHHAVLEIMKNSLDTNPDAKATNRLLETASSIASTVPCFCLQFEKNPGFWRMLSRREIGPERVAAQVSG